MNGELYEIINYNGNEKELKQLIKTNYNPSLIKKQEKNKYDELGILFDESGNIKYKGKFKDGRFNGFGKKYDSNNLIMYEGYFKNNEYNGKGILYRKGTKIYDGYFLDDLFEGIGIEYFFNGNIKRKAKYQNGAIKGICFGVLYDDNNKEIYKGLLMNGRPKEGKSLPSI